MKSQIRPFADDALLYGVMSNEEYYFYGVKLEQVESMSYLGVIFNDDLKWSNHVSTISGKASGVLGMMKRNLWNCLKKVKEIAYTTSVRPKLEYACIAWDPYLQNGNLK